MRPGRATICGIVLMGDDVAVELDMHVGDQIVAVFDAAIFDRNQRALLLAQVLHRLIDVLVGDFDLRLLDLQAVEVRKRDLRLHFDLERIAQRPVFGELDRFGIVELRLADDLQVVLLDRLLVALADERAADLFLDVVGRIASRSASAGHGPTRKPGMAACWRSSLNCSSSFGGDPILGDFDGDLLGRRAGVLDLDRVGELLFLLLVQHGRFVLCHDQTSSYSTDDLNHTSRTDP